MTWDTKGSACVDGEPTMWMMTVTAAAEEVENNLKKHSDVGGVCIVGNVEELEDEKMMDECREFCEEEEGTGRPGCRSKYSAQSRADRRDGFSEIRAGQNDGSSKIGANRWGGASRVEANICDKFGQRGCGTS